MSNGEPTVGPAYVAYPSWENLISQFKEHGIPSQIDRSVMGSFSGGTQSHLMSAMRHLRLIGANNTPLPALRTLVDTVGTDKWAAALAPVIRAAYGDILGDLDVLAATPQQVEQKFRDAGLEGTTVDKAMRFYLSALKEAKLPHSPHLIRRRRAPGSRRERITRRISESDDTQRTADVIEDQDDNSSGEMMSFPLHLPGKPVGKIVVPKSITPTDCKLIEAQMAVISIYAAQNQGKTGAAEIDAL